jgi:Zn-finger nucleic acid-binding protein
MKCPIDNTELRMTDRQGIEIDYCPQCRGVWLDRGELDKLIERSATLEAEARRETPYARKEYDRDDDRDDDEYYRRTGKKRRKSFLGDMFDIFD